LFDQSWHVGRDDYRVSTTPIRLSFYCDLEIWFMRIERKSAKVFGMISPKFDRVGSEYGRPEALGQHREDEAYRALAEDRYTIASPQTEQADCLQAGIYGFNPAGLIERYTIGNRLDATIYNPVHYANVLRETTAGRLVASGYTHSLVHRTLSIEAPIAVEALATRYVVENDHAIAWGVSRDSIANGCNDAGSLVAVDARWREKIVLDFFEIGMTNPAALNPDQNLVLLQRRSLDAFERDAARASIDGRSHDAGYCIIRQEQCLTSA
jgi:hypothetical protein